MKRVLICAVLFVAVVIYAIFCQVYVSGTVKQTNALLAQAAESRQVGDTSVSREHVDSAWEKWNLLTKKSGFILADLTVTADVTISLSRVVSLSRTDDSDRFFEECAATILLLEHFLGDNQNFLDGVA
ncbi:MAG: DUF4363 family protein [Oscillospiraceae bacterium]|nr:DUF4363 family protein [Oscillospiraceae bacterium]